MKILDLQLSHFGKFHGRHVEFEPGLNIIYGKNEAGKSTIHTFIHGMLFGLEHMKKSSLQKMDTYDRYEPWENQGTAAYEGTLRVEVDDVVYRIERSFLKEHKYLRLFDETNGTELEPAQEKLTSLLGNLTEVTFANTISIGQMRSSTDAELQDELRNYVANLGSTQNKDIDLAETEANLRAEEKRLESSINYEAEARLQSLRDEHNTMLTEINSITEDKAAKEAERQSIQDRLDEVLYDVENATAEHDRKIAEIDASIAKEVQWLQETSKGSPITMKDRIIIFAMWGVALALLVFGAIQIFNSDLLIGILCLVIALVFVVIGIVLHISNTKSDAKYREFIERQSELRKKTDDLDNLKRNWNPPNPEEVPQLQAQISTIDNTIRQHTWEIELKQEVMIRIESDIAHTEEICASNEAAKQELEAVHEAMQTLSRMSAEIHETFGDKLNQYASEYLAQITEGKYTAVIVDEAFNITLNTPDRIVPLDQLSRGTIEQVYLSVRLSAAKLLWDRKPMPIMLDDVFAFYDEIRLASALTLLKSLDCQVLLFTCHKREQNIIDQQDDRK